jgi:hypothetical protein
LTKRAKTKHSRIKVDGAPKVDKRANGTGRAGRPAKLARVDSVIDYPTARKDAQGKPTGEWLPSLLDAVADMLPMGSRGHCVAVLTARYGVTAATVDRAIAQFKAIAADELALDRGDRIRLTYEKLHLIARRATREKQFHSARGALTDAAKLAGDMRADVLLLTAGADRPADELQAQAQELKEIADRRRPSK